MERILTEQFVVELVAAMFTVLGLIMPVAGFLLRLGWRFCDWSFQWFCKEVSKWKEIFLKIISRLKKKAGL